MEKRVLMWMTWCFGLLTVVMCTSLYLMPMMKDGFPTITLTWPEFSFQETPIEIDQNTIALEKKLNIELPKGITGKDVQITNDYVNHVVYVRFANGVDNYSENYSVRGSSDHIANLSYYKEGTDGVMEIKLDKACEHSYSYENGYLRMEFKDLHDVYEKIIVVDAGHGGSQPGAVKLEIYEKQLNLEIVLKLKEILDEVDENKLKVFYTRLEDKNPSLKDRSYMANQLDADLFISVHNNASNTGKFTDLSGTMVLYNPDQPEDQSKKFAQICLENVIESTGNKNLGLVTAEDIFIVRTSEVPVALIEVGYMTNTQELENLCDPSYQEKVAQGIYNAIMEAFEEGF